MFRIELTLPNLAVVIPPAARLAEDLARRVGFSESDSVALRTAVEEGCAYVMRRAFEPNQRATIQVVVELEGRGLRIRIRDRGLPLDTEALQKHLQAGSTLPRHLGVRLLRASVDELSFRHLGREGNELSLFKQLKGQLPRTLFRELKRADRVPACDQVEIRRARPEEALGVSRCIYRSYGYTYTGEENVYSPEWLVQMHRSQMLVSAVAVAGEEVIGHVALTRMDGCRSVYDLGQGAVDPRYRSRGLLTKMISFLLDEAKNLGLEFVYGDPVTTHTHSQKALARFDFTETGLMLAAVGGETQRLSLLPSLRVVKRPPSLTLHLPVFYRDFLNETLERAGLSFQEEATAEPHQKGQLSWGVHSLSERGFIRVEKGGLDSDDQLEKAIRHLLAEKVAVVLLDLNLTDPSGQMLCRLARRRGFFYSALLPGMGDGMVLRLQYLNQLELDEGQITTLTTWGEKVRRFVLADRARISLKA